MSGRKRRSLLGNAPVDGSPAAAGPADTDQPGEAVVAPSLPPEGPEVAAVETESPPPISGKTRRRLINASGEYTDESTGEAEARASAPSNASSGLVSFDEPPVDEPGPPTSFGERRAARRTASRDPDLAYRRPSMDPDPVRRSRTPEPDPESRSVEQEPRLRPEKSRSPFGDLKVVEKPSGRKPSGPSPFFRGVPPEDAAVYENVAPVGPTRRPSTTPDVPAFEKVAEPHRISKKPATRGAPEPPDNTRAPGPRSRLRVEKADPDSKVGHKDALSWNQVAPNQPRGQTLPEPETPAPPPMKRGMAADRGWGSAEPSAPKKAPVGEVNKAPLESIDANASPSLPGLFGQGGTPEPAPRAAAAEQQLPAPAARTASQAPAPPKPAVANPTEDEDESPRGDGIPLSTLGALLLIPLSIVFTLFVAYAAWSPRGTVPEPEKPRQVVPAAPRIPLPSEVPPPPVEDTMPPTEPTPDPVSPPVPGVAAPKPKPRVPAAKPPVVGAVLTEDRGLVKVRANKHGLIHVNGVAKSFTPDQLSLPPGTYTITVTIPDGPSLNQTVTVRKDKTEPLEFTFP